MVTIAPDATIATISARIRARESMPALTGLVPLIAWNWKVLVVSIATLLGEIRSDGSTYPNRNIVNVDEEGAADANAKERR